MRFGNYTAGLVLALLLIGSGAQAQVPAYDLQAAGYTGTFNWAGQLGLAFDVVSPVQVTALGAFDSGQDGFAGTVTARLWRSSDQSLLAIQNFTGTSTATAGVFNGDHRFLNLVSPLTLTAGRYIVSVSNFLGADKAGLVGSGGFIHDTFNTGGGLLSIASVTTGYYSESANPTLYPGQTFGSDPLWVNSASFLFQAPGGPPVTVTPEPGSAALLCGLLMTGVGFTTRRCRARK